ncbi:MULTISPECIES: SDR family NAD(P)-dependent oxidoreductase [Sphingopyxis]|uniref:SDR family NAD(P)-dependent oxidoreductase n=1 Tax=Sphingopyxis TaxID=165697 RepID=UPI0006AD2AF0|nr:MULTISPECIES: SDR family oxidoreductase [Sphingopyxis]ALC10491.1 3-oxoacyl-[acyl-carrier protein] reductase [Sphingopyxis sp. 113P3]
MGERLVGKVALITGGTSGIGEATVELFIEQGCKVVFTGRNADKGATIAARLGDAAFFVEGDIRSEAAVKAAIDATTDRFGRLDCLFNNAGGPTRGTLETVTWDDYRDAMDLLVAPVVFGIKYAAPIMKAQGSGAIINNASVAALRTNYGGHLYSGAKAAVRQITKVAGSELAPWGITVNSIAPGGIATPIFFGGSERAAGMEEGHVAASMAKLEKNLASATPMQRSGFPKDIAYGALYLASDEGRFVTCHDLVIDAGMTAAGKTSFEGKPPAPTW